MTYIFLHIFACCWFYGWGGDNDNFKSGGGWLRRHIPGWNTRDCGVIASHIVLWDMYASAMPLWAVIAVYAVCALLYGLLFDLGYRDTKKSLDNIRRPAWYVWRPFQIIPGLAIGFIYRYLLSL